MSTTIEKLRAQCRIDIDDTTEDEVLTLYYGAARRKAENFINRHLYEDEVPETVYLFTSLFGEPCQEQPRQ